MVHTIFKVILISANDLVKDLGVIIAIDEKLKFHAYTYTASVVAKPNHTLAVIHKYFH